MDFRILGPLEALDGGRVVRLGGARQRALLAVFLLHRGVTLSSDRLIDKQLERRALSEWVGWMKLDNSATQCLDIQSS